MSEVDPSTFFSKIYKLYLELEDILNDLSHQNSTPSPGNNGPEKPFENPLNISLQGDIFYIDQILVALHTRPRTLDLIRALASSPNFSLSKEELCFLLYGDANSRSFRYKEAVEKRLNKLVSRTRDLLELAVGDHWADIDIKWIYFDFRTRHYHLYQIHPFRRGNRRGCPVELV